LIVDASVALSWLYQRESVAEQALAQQVLAQLPSDPAVVPALWQWEIANGLLVAERRRIMSAAEVADYLNRLLALPIEVDTAGPRGCLQVTLALARQYALTAYDAAYLELAVRRGSPLATFDMRLARAAAALGLLYGADPVTGTDPL